MRQTAVIHWAKGLLSSMVLLAVPMVGCADQPSQPPQQQAAPPAPVTLQTLEIGTHVDTTQYVGTLEARQRVSVTPQASGRLVEIRVEEGEVVQPGQTLFILDRDEQQASVEEAEAGVVQSEATVNTAIAQLEEAQANRNSAAADLTLREIEFNRQSFLADEGAATEQARDEAQTNLDSAIAALEAAEKSVVAAEKRLDETNASLVAAQAEVSRSQAQLGYKQVVASSSGTIGDILPRVGDLIEVGQQITTLTQNNELNLNVNIPIGFSDRLRLGLPVELLEPNSDSVMHRGEVSFINPVVNGESQTLLAKFSFTNDGRLKDDQFVKARVIWDETPGVLVPTSAVLRLGGQSFVFVAEPSPERSSQWVARQRPVDLGTIQGQSYQVLSGLQPGDQIITTGILNLTDGGPIAPNSGG